MIHWWTYGHILALGQTRLLLLDMFEMELHPGRSHRHSCRWPGSQACGQTPPPARWEGQKALGRGWLGGGGRVRGVSHIGGRSRGAPEARAPLGNLHTSCAPPSNSYTTVRMYQKWNSQARQPCAWIKYNYVFGHAPMQGPHV